MLESWIIHEIFNVFCLMELP